MVTRKRAGGELLERADELAALDFAVADVEAGGGGFAVIEGTAGIGKSSLLAESRARAADAGVLRARRTEIAHAGGCSGARSDRFEEPPSKVSI